MESEPADGQWALTFPNSAAYTDHAEVPENSGVLDEAIGLRFDGILEEPSNADAS
jgi:hypothetical protein